MPNEFGGRENLQAIGFLKEFNEQAAPAVPRRADDRRGIDRLARRLAADVPGRPGLQPEVEHGLDERHAPLHAARADPPQVPPRRADLQPDLRLPRELRPAAVARRSGPRQGLAPGPDARRPVAEVRQPAAACTATCGRIRARSCLFMGGDFGQWNEWNFDTSLQWDLLAVGVAPGPAEVRGRPEPPATAARRRCTRSISTTTASSGSIATTTRTAR